MDMCCSATVYVACRFAQLEAAIPAETAPTAQASARLVTEDLHDSDLLPVAAPGAGQPDGGPVLGGASTAHDWKSSSAGLEPLPAALNVSEVAFRRGQLPGLMVDAEESLVFLFLSSSYVRMHTHQHLFDICRHAPKDQGGSGS
jgi:hypothetical protein